MLLPYESSEYSFRDLQQQGIESQNSGVFINKEAKGHQGNPGTRQQRKIQFRTCPVPASLGHTVSDQRT